MTLRPCRMCGKAHHGTIDQLCKETPVREREQILKDQIESLRYYLGLEHQRIEAAQKQSKNLLRKIQQLHRGLQYLEKEKRS